MAESQSSGQMVEKIVLELQTNFEEVLKADLTKYSSFVKDTTGLANSIQKSFNTAAGDISKSVGSMFESTQKNIVTSVGQAKGLMRQISQQNIQIAEKYSGMLDNLTRAQKKFTDGLKEADNIRKRIHSLEKLSGGSDNKMSNWALGEIKKETENLAKMRDGLMSDFNKVNKDETNLFVTQVSTLAAQTVKGLALTAKANLDAVKAVANDVFAQLNRLKGQSGLKSEIDQIFSYQEHFKEIENAHGNLQKQLMNQLRDKNTAERAMKDALVMYHSSTDEKLKLLAYENYKSAVKNYTGILKTYREMEKAVDEFIGKVANSGKELEGMGSALRKSIKDSIRSDDLRGAMKKAMNNLEQYAEMAGKDVGAALLGNIKEGNEFSSKINEKINDLKKLRDQALKLQKTGLVGNMNAEIERIDALSNKYKEMFAKYRSDRDQAMKVLGSRKVFDDRNLGLEKFRDVQGSFDGLVDASRNFGRVTDENFMSAYESSQKLLGLDKDLLKSRENLVSKRTMLEKRMGEVSIALTKTVNAKVKQEYEKDYNAISENIARINDELGRQTLSTANVESFFKKIEKHAVESQEKMQRALSVSPKGMTSLMESAMGNLVEYAKTSGTAIGQALTSGNLEDAKRFESLLHKRIQYLEEIKQKALDLKKTGLVDTSNDIKEIDQLLAKFKGFIGEFKREQQNVYSVFGKQRIFDDKTLGLDKFNELYASYDRIIHTVESFGAVHDQNFRKAMENVSKLKKLDDQVYNGKKQLESKKQELINHMSNLEVAMAKSTNSQILAELHKRYSETKVSYDKVVSAIESRTISTAQFDAYFNDIRMGAEKAKDKMQTGFLFNGDDIEASFNNLMSNLVDYARKSGNKIGSALEENIQKGRLFEDSFEDQIKLLERFKKEAVELNQTGIVDTTEDIKEIDRLMDRVKKFASDYKAQQQQVYNILGRRESFESKKLGFNEINDVIKSYRNLAREVDSFGKVHAENFSKAFDNVLKLKKLDDQLEANKRKLAAKQSMLMNEMTSIELAKRKTTDSQLLAVYDRYYNELKGKHDQLVKYMNTTVFNSARFQEEYKRIGKAATAAVREMTNLDKVGLSFDQLSGMFDVVQQKANRLARTRFIGKDSIEDVTNGLKTVQVEIARYKERLLQIQNELQKLMQMKKSGFAIPGLDKNINDLKNVEIQMKKNIHTLHAMSTTAHNTINKLNSQSLKGIFSSGMEMLRNFRWQVAGVIYLATRAVWAIKNAYINVMDEIAQYRREAMSLAAQFSYSMIGDINRDFNKIYGFARELLERMEQVAARTILTMEDMTTLVRTFAQAGIIPETDDDLDKVATIGTAIRALTEGMANAGTQMKQELNAIIMGRQRATDQLAMMFKLMGVDIQKTIDDAKMRGENMLDALSNALKPFSVLNEKLADEWEAVINNMKLAWKVIKRIGLEDFLLKKTAKLNEFVNQFYDKINGITEKGREVSATLLAAFEIVSAAASGILAILKSNFEIMRQLVDLTTLFGGSITSSTNSLKGLTNNMRSLLATTELVLKILWVVEYTLRSIHVTLKSAIAGVMYLLRGVDFARLGIKSLVLTNFDPLKKGMKDFQQSYDDMLAAGEEWVGLIGKAGSSYENINEIIKQMAENVNKVSDNTVDLERHLQLLDISEIFEFKNRMKEAELAGLEGPQKHLREYYMALEEIVLVKQKIQKNIEDIGKAYEQVMMKSVDVMDNDFDIMHLKLEAQKEALDSLVKYEEHLLRKRQKQDADYYDALEKRRAEMKDRADSFLIELYEKPDNPFEKVLKWHQFAISELEKLYKTNDFVNDNIGDFLNALEHGAIDRLEQAFESIQNEADGFLQKLVSDTNLNELEKIDNEFQKLAVSIAKSKNLTPEMRDALMDVWKVSKDIAIVNEKIEQSYRNQSKWLDLMSMSSNRKQESFLPSVVLQGEMEEMVIQYKRAMTDIEKEMNRVVSENKIGDVWKDNTERAQEYWNMLREEGDKLTEYLEQDLLRKQRGIWMELTDLSKGWADGLSDVLADLILDFDNFEDSLKNLNEAILRDVVKTTIHKGFTENLMDALGGGGESGIGFMEAFFGKKSDPKNDILNQFMDKFGGEEPVPVRIVDNLANDLELAVNNVGDTIEKTGNKTKDALNIGFGSLKSLLGVVETGVMGGGMSVTEGLLNIGTSIVNAYAGYSSGGSSTGGSGGYSLGDYQNMPDSGIFDVKTSFAEGGDINEHIVGRGLSSGRIYEFGEAGEPETVVPRSKILEGMRKGAKLSHSVSVSMPINIQAIDSRSGVDFLMQNQGVIEAGLVRALKNNRKIRNMVISSR